MKKLLVSMSAAALLLTSCGSVPITGRKQLNLVSDSEVLQSSLSQYSSFMKSATVSTDKTPCAQVERVGKKIAAATETYLKNNGAADEVKNFSWEFNLVKSDEVNAWCMPGGKIVVYEGLMKIIGSDDELAVVLGHEVAHAVAKHSNERMSQQVLAQYGAQALGVATSGKSEAVQKVAQSVYGLGANYAVVLPFSRKHESEADYMGLVLMMMAGYNPEVATTFWQKMSAQSTSKVPEFLSTHPSDSKRIADIQKEIPEIEKKYAAYIPKKAAATTTTSSKKTTTTKSKTKKK